LVKESSPLIEKELEFREVASDINENAFFGNIVTNIN
jgi:hypothetical protein